MPDSLSTTQLTLNEAHQLYENGKHRRYSLMFAVNGGAFAIAKLLTGEPGKSGMALFTAFMAWDIYVFGQKMRATYLSDSFQWRGKAVLVILGALQFIGWLLVAGSREGGA
jgi:hypothetical protein